jgi:transmembrane sensor
MTGFERFGARIASEQDRLRSRGADAMRARLREIAASTPVGRRRFAPRTYAIGCSMALVMATGAWLLASKPVRPSQLTVVLGRAATRLSAATFIEADAREPSLLRFSDGTRVELAPRSRGRLVELDADGAHILLESGLARVHVIHRARTRYRFSAGPFKVLVTGTRFELRWNPDADAFELALQEGRVELSGCAFGPGYQMPAGQRVRASCKGKGFIVSAIDAEQVPAAPLTTGSASAGVERPSAAASASAGEQATGRTRSRPSRPSAQEPADWLALARAGKYVPAFDAAEAAGFEAQAKRAGPRELLMLADAARLAGATRREASALHQLRKRFAGTEAAAIAAFSLGRLEFDHHAGYQQAAQWFETYLKEQPSGALSREARGRLIEATVRAGDLARARSLADGYLHDYPAGPHAKLARSLQ